MVTIGTKYCIQKPAHCTKRAYIASVNVSGDSLVRYVGRFGYAVIRNLCLNKSEFPEYFLHNVSKKCANFWVAQCSRYRTRY